ncbi:hypothetical protein BKA70DRAFT_1304774 [Coprinopsis sp. MPI-PUGE-AT-0042]|nr:hypothetical protein BKA70DRAFT_1304774 [Coprinopsis sp. MPI-PUGE-AT-0042]
MAALSLSQNLIKSIAQVPPTQYSGPGIIQGAQNLTISGGVFNLSNHQGGSPQDRERTLGKWTPGTIKWLLESIAILWGTGIPGAGKTILASVAIQYCEELAQASSDTCVAFVYCRYTEPMKVRDILAALARQLVERFPHLLPVVEPLYAKHDLQRTKVTQSELIYVICEIFKCFRIAYLFIDGLDEALDDEQFDLLDTLKSVPANFFITSRPLALLKDVLPNVEFFDIAAQLDDIKLFVSRHIHCNPGLQQVLATDEQREMVITNIFESSRGMFLHASLMIEAVRHCTSSRRVVEQLEKLPAKLDVLYDEAFKRIEMQPEERAALAKHILLWVAYAYRPLTVDDLRYATASDPKIDWEAPERLVPQSLLVSVCCGLITVEGDQSNPIVRLVHYTALDAVKRILARRETSPHCLLAEITAECLVYSGVPTRQPTPSSSRLPSSPLLNYAYDYWHLHAKESIQSPVQPDARPVASILRFLAMCTSYIALEDSNSPNEFDYFERPIHLIVYYHLPIMLPLIHPHVNAQTKEGKSVLSLAGLRNDAVMAELLLQLDGIDVNAQDKDGNTALMLAAQSGSADVVKTLLLDPRIDIYKRNKREETALHCALARGSGHGHTDAALRLIATPGVDINAADDLGRTPLMMAYRHPPRLLDSLARHPDIDFLKTDNAGQTPLMHACREGTSAAVQWYLRLPGADARDCSGASALAHRARTESWRETYENYLSDFQALADAGLDVNGKDEKGLTALAYAVRDGLTDVTRALLQLDGVDVNLEDSDGRTLLMVACDAVLEGKHRQTLDSLIQHPIFDINAKNQHGTTVLAHAVAQGVLETAEGMLLDTSHRWNNVLLKVEHRAKTYLTMGLLHEVPELSVHLRFSDYQTWDASVKIIVEGTKPPYPPGFRLSRGIIVDTTTASRLRFPWEHGWISEENAKCARLLLNHPDIEDHGFRFLRHGGDGPGNLAVPSFSPVAFSPTPGAPSPWFGSPPHTFEPPSPSFDFSSLTSEPPPHSFNIPSLTFEPPSPPSQSLEHHTSDLDT